MNVFQPQNRLFVLQIAPSYKTKGASSNFLPDIACGVAPASCQAPNCSLATTCITNAGLSTLVSISNQSDLLLQLTLENSTFVWNANGLNLEGQLAEVRLNLNSNSKGRPLDNPNVAILYQIPHADTYDWTGSGVPGDRRLLVGTSKHSRITHSYKCQR